MASGTSDVPGSPVSVPPEQAGWGKKLSYVLAFSKDGVRDVTRRYTASFADLAPRWRSTPRWTRSTAAGSCRGAFRNTKGVVHMRRMDGG